MGLRLALLLVLAAGVTHQLIHGGSGHGHISSENTFDSDLRNTIMERLLAGKAIRVEVVNDRRLSFGQDTDCARCGGPTAAETTPDAPVDSLTETTVAPPVNHAELCLRTFGPPTSNCSYRDAGILDPLTCPVECHNSESQSSNIAIR
ncbi:hypothetical protein RvY_04186 [Ramazzottius varieornatus]|uniref:Uncharacterized protein n=1 Tax=Ramazzottius varieornatus TaxID=947166 RepID=A0A1D1UU46_RAMVA|nr:hypothetical protein RvY_04186 [Ramazzottius varieornatus]